jgi:hypothetical protein
LSEQAHDDCKMPVETQARDQPGKNRQSRNYCFDCPLCCPVTLKPFMKFEIWLPASRFEYTVMHGNILSDYYQRHWKPPAASSPS